jgi:hypothetical protein
MDASRALPLTSVKLTQPWFGMTTHTVTNEGQLSPPPVSLQWEEHPACTWNTLNMGLDNFAAFLAYIGQLKVS